MVNNVNLKSVSPETISKSSAALRQVQIAKEKPVTTVEQPDKPRQAVAAEESKSTDSRQQLAEAKQIVVKLKDQVQHVSRQLVFRVDEESGRTLIKVTDRETGETIREIPSEEMIELGHRLKELAETLHSTKQNSTVGIAGLLVKIQA